MDRKFFYRLAFLLALVSFIPLVIFLSRKEVPPDRISVKVHKKQTVENFVLNSSGRENWTLKAPLAVFEGKDVLRLKSPVLIVFKTPSITVKAQEATFFKLSGKLILKGVYLKSGDIEAWSKEGVYFVEKELFLGKKGCWVTSGSSKTFGDKCTLSLRDRKVIITKNVKTVITGERA